MKIGITSTGPTLEDRVEPYFKRCAFFLVIDRELNRYESILNPNIALGGIAGEKSALLIINKGVSAVLTGNCDPNDIETFGLAGIRVITGVNGQVSEAIEQFRAGRLSDLH